MREVEFLHDYWKNPADENQPERYLAPTRNGRTELLLDMVKSAGVKPEHTIFEIGSNIGRNLNALWKAGYKNLGGVEINAHAVSKMKTMFPKVRAKVLVGPVEQHIDFVEHQDLFLSMTVFMHLHPDSEWVFEKVAEKANKWLITFEDECDHNSERILSRQYKDIFENLGMKCVRTEKEIRGMSAVYTARLFEK